MSTLIRRDNRDLSWDPFRVLFRWDPFAETRAVRGNEIYTPHFDVKENKDRFTFTADLPGVKESDLEISVTGNVLTITGKRENELREEGEQYYRAERSYGQFTRSFVLPESTDTAGVQADLKDGVLTLQVPKRPEVQPRRIAIGKGRPENAAKA
jgi:HSP20 family protein